MCVRLGPELFYYLGIYVPFRNPNAVLAPYLIHDPVDLAILGVNLVTHIESHVAQVADDAPHLLQVLVHLIFPSVIRYPAKRTWSRG